MALISAIFLFFVAAFSATSPSRSVDAKASIATSTKDWLNLHLPEQLVNKDVDNVAANPEDLVNKVVENVAANSEELVKSATSDPEVHMKPKQIIERWDYPAEEYEVTTQDGFILSVQRIPGPRKFNRPSNQTDKPKPVLFLMHGLLQSSADWLANLPNQSLPYLAADAGFDVWLGNARGNTYSRRHTQYKPEDSSFWAFSWDEIAKYDIDAMVKLALYKSGQEQLYYVGHSQGSLVMFAHASEDLEFGKKIKEFYALGPVTTCGNVQGAPRLLGKIHNIIDAGSWITGKGEFLPKNFLIDQMAQSFCKSSLKFICTNILVLLSGTDDANLNMTRFPVYMTHTPAGTSAQNMVHFGQLIDHGEFKWHDYGFIKNLFHYRSTRAPLYDVSKMEVPTVLFWGGKDTLADPDDVHAMIPKLKNLRGNYFHPDMDHLDYIWGLNAPELIYEPIIRMMKKHENMDGTFRLHLGPQRA